MYTAFAISRSNAFQLLPVLLSPGSRTADLLDGAASLKLAGRLPFAFEELDPDRAGRYGFEGMLVQADALGLSQESELSGILKLTGWPDPAGLLKLAGLRFSSTILIALGAILKLSIPVGFFVFLDRPIR